MIEQVMAPSTMDGCEGILAYFITSFRKEVQKNPVHFITHPDEPQQVALIAYPEGHTIPLHRHHPRVRTVERTTEVLVVREGLIKVYIYAGDGEFVAQRVLGVGEVVILLGGCHAIEIIQDAEILEVKQGPYAGRVADKVEIMVEKLGVSAHGTVPKA